MTGAIPGNAALNVSFTVPRVRTGDERVSIGEYKKSVISEAHCVGCGICVKKCPFEAIDIVSLPEELEHATHRFGINGFALYGLPIPVEGKVTGILGENGIGKSTAVKILSGQLKPNLGEFEREAGWDEILRKYTGTELFDYLRTVSEKRLKVAIKPQYIDYIPRVFSGTPPELLKTTDERGKLQEYIGALTLSPLLDHDISTLSGGELQRVAIVACLAREADFYFLDEITIWESWTEVPLQGGIPDALAWGQTHNEEILFWLEVDSGHSSTRTMERNYSRRLQLAYTHAAEWRIPIVFCIMGSPWVVDAFRWSIPPISGRVAVIGHDWRDFGNLPMYQIGEWREDLKSSRHLFAKKAGGELPFDPNQYPPKPKQKTPKHRKPKSTKPRYFKGSSDDDCIWKRRWSEGED